MENYRRPSASWAINSEPIRARGIIVKYYVYSEQIHSRWLEYLPGNFVTAVFTPADNPSLNPSKLTEKQMDKVRWIVHLKLRPFYYQIKTYYLCDPDYPMDNPFQTDNPSLVWIRSLSRNYHHISFAISAFRHVVLEKNKKKTSQLIYFHSSLI